MSTGNVGLAKIGPPGSESWAAALLAETKAAYVRAEASYAELARYLHLVATTHVDNDPAKPGIVSLWGYGSFEEWVEKDLGLHPRKARSLRFIAQRVEADLALPETVKADVYKLGWTKAREVVRVLTDKNASLWVKVAQDSTQKGLEDTVRTALATAASKMPKPQTAAAMFETASSTALPAKTAAKTPAKSETPPGGLSAAAVAAIDSVEPQPLPTEAMTFHLHPGQKAIVEVALDRAAEVTGSTKKGHNLSLALQGWLATSGFLTPKTSMQVFAQNLADALGCRVVFVDLQTTQALADTHPDPASSEPEES